MRRLWISSIEEKDKWMKWMKEDVELCIYSRECSVFSPNDIFSKSLNMAFPYMSIDLQSEFERILLAVIKEVSYNYDYYYMLNATNEAYEEKTNTLVTGSSYSLFGFDKRQLAGSVNLGLSSQDIYYTIKGLRNILEKNSSIENIVIMAGPYYFFSDLSRTKEVSEISRVSKVYQPLYNDVHNAMFLEPRMCFLPESCIWNVSKLLEIYSISEYQRGYFNEDRPRERFQVRTRTRTCSWCELTEEERAFEGEKRAVTHNKSIEYVTAFDENENLFNDFIQECNERKINVLMVIAPATQYYRAFLDERYIEEFYEVLDRCSGVVHLIDLFESDDFDNSDFIDVDHMSEKGAIKLTNIISDLLYSL